jgi:hypothetical protein
VLSSTSSSNRSPPNFPWRPVWVGALAITAIFVGVMELRLLARGFPTTSVDSELSWLRQRERASNLGEKALVLIGDSRMQCDIDTDVLRQRTALEPVQLAIDGNSFVPVLAGLAADPNVRGTILVSFLDETLADDAGAAADPAWPDVAGAYESDFEHHRHSGTLNYEASEAMLTDAIRSHLRSYADSARPISSLMKRILVPSATPHYAVVLPDRSRLIDFRMVKMPDFYYARAVRTLGQEVDIQSDMAYAQVDAMIKARIDALTPRANDVYLQRIASIVAMVAAIEARGGRVVFLAFPTSGFITDMHDKRFPRQQFWNNFAQALPAHATHFADVPELQKFRFPDGSHLDYRNRGAFTLVLANVLGLGAAANQTGATLP